MKKIIAILLAIFMSAVSVFASAATYTLPEKMQKQQEAGSGLKGSFSIEAEGTSPVMMLLKELSGREIQIRGISARDSENYVYSLYLDSGDDNRMGLVEIMNRDGELFIRNEADGNTVYTLGTARIVFDMLTAEDGQNVQIWSSLRQLLSIPDEEWESTWKPVTERMTKQIENWMNNFASDPVKFTTEDGESALELRYEIEPQSIRSGIIELITMILNDEEAVTLLSGKMAPEQAAIYLNKDLIWYYQEALNAMELNGPVILSRKMTTKGEEINSSISLPLGTNPFGFDTVTAENTNGSEEWIFSGEEVTVRYIPGEQQKGDFTYLFTCGLVITPGTKEEGFLSKAGAYTLKINGTTETTTDEEGKEHQNETWTLQLIPDMALVTENQDLYKDCEPLNGELKLHYYSKLAQTSATTLEINGSYEYGEDKLTGTAKIKTSSAWELVPFDTANAVEVLKMTDEEFMKALESLMKVGK